MLAVVLGMDSIHKQLYRGVFVFFFNQVVYRELIGFIHSEFQVNHSSMKKLL